MGTGLYVPAVGATVIILLILAGIKPLEERFRVQVMGRDLRLRCERGVVTFQGVAALLDPSIAPHIRRFIIEQTTDGEVDEITISLASLPARRFDELVGKLRDVSGVYKVES